MTSRPTNGQTEKPTDQQTAQAHQIDRPREKGPKNKGQTDGFHSVYNIGTIPRFVTVKTCFFWDN